jgi:site-specific recombinase XerD
MSKLSITFFPNTAKRAERSETTPVYVRLVHKNKKAESRLNLELTDWEVKNWHSGFMRVDSPNCIANDFLNSIDIEFKKFVSVNALEISNMSVQEIRDTVLKKDQGKNQSGILNYVEQYYEKSISSKAGLSTGTKINYRKAITHLANYLQQEKLANLSFKDFEHKHAEGFKNYLLSEKPIPGKRNMTKPGMTEPSALGNIKKFKTIFDQAFEEGLITRNYFKRLKLSNRSPRKPRCTIDQLKSLYKLQDNLTIHEELCRDLIVFSSLTGLAFLDTVKLPKIYLEIRSTGEVKLVRPRTKTGEQVEQFLPSFAMVIINKYRQHPQVQNSQFVFPYVDNSDYNKTLKYLALRAGIGFKVTTHTARHTFRQLLPEAGVQDAAVISRMMGKVGSDKIDSVYYEITEARLREAKERFELYLKNNLNE